LEDFQKALNYSFLLLKYRARSKKEIIDRLRRRKYPLAVIEKTLEFLEDQNYVNDEKFAVSFIRERLRKGFGKRKIIFDLKRLGLSKELIEEELGKIDNNQYRDTIRGLMQKRLRRYRGNQDAKNKIFCYLVQRGFAPDDIKEVIDEIR